MAVQLEGARMLLARAVRLAGPGGTPPPLETALAKTAANLAAKFVCDEAMQIHGGYGYSREYPLERAYRDIRGLCFGAGTVEAQKQLHRPPGVAPGRAPAHPAGATRSTTALERADARSALHRLGLDELLEAVLAALAPDARLLVAAEGRASG